jgi:hypothetical protein
VSILVGPIIFLLATLLGAQPVQSVHPITILKPSGVPEDFGIGFGNAVAISGDYIAIGAPHGPWHNGNMIGAVYVYQLVGPNWVERAVLTGSDAGFRAQMGTAVDMDGDTIVAGAPAWEPSACELRRVSAAYVFERNDQGTPTDDSDDIWVETAKLIAPDPSRGRALGYSVAIKGDVIVLGSECSESVEVFHRVNGEWVHQATLIDPQPHESHEFGSAVDTDGHRIVVGSYGYNQRRGKAFVYQRVENGWKDEGVLENTNARDFGRFVAILERTLVVGAPGEHIRYDTSTDGAAYVYNYADNSWWETKKLIASNLGAVRSFGWPVSLDDGFILVDVGWQLLPSLGTEGHIFDRASQPCSEIMRLQAKDVYLGPSSIDQNYALMSAQVFVVRNRKSLEDVASFLTCFYDTTAACEIYDIDKNGVIDFYDFGEMMALVGGP